MHYKHKSHHSSSILHYRSNGYTDECINFTRVINRAFHVLELDTEESLAMIEAKSMCHAYGVLEIGN